MGIFVDERGYTSVATAVALLVSVSLVFCVATAEWTVSRGADVQCVADAAALAGANVVAGYCTVAQVLDACVLSLGLTGMAVLGSGLVLAAIPGAQAASVQAMDAGRRILDARGTFARSAVEGLQRVEQAIPALCVANSASCVGANAADGVAYSGLAIPFPLESSSDFSSLVTEVGDDGLEDAADRLRRATSEAKDAKERADAARLAGWRADCVDDPSCLRSRAASLAEMAGVENPGTSSSDEWNFGLAIRRARTYYARRLERETPKADDIESRVDSIARAAWYRYALQEVNGAWYRELSDGSVDLMVPHLARNASEVRGCWLYDDASWPCTLEEGGRTLHATLECPGATGASNGCASVREVDEGSVQRCSTCLFDASDLGAVANISTSAKNGFEHYWQAIVEAAQAYGVARNEQAAAERSMRDVAEEGKGAFERALEQLRVPRPRICPPGYLGVVSVVRRDGGTAVPSELTRSFLPGTTIPAGMAVSAATLAPDEDTKENGVLARFYDGLSTSGQNPLGGVLDGALELWGSLLRSYGASYEGVGSCVGGFLDNVDGAFGGTVGSWLKCVVADAMDTLGLQPADMRLKKPTLTSTGNVLGSAGFDVDTKLHQLVLALPSGGTSYEQARALGVWVWDELRGKSVTVARLPVPGSDESVPFELDLGSWDEAA